MIPASYYHFTISGNVELVHELKAQNIIQDRNKSWLIEPTKDGVLYTEDLELVFFDSNYGMQAKSMKYNLNASKLINTMATRILGFEVFGECILESRPVARE